MSIRSPDGALTSESYCNPLEPLSYYPQKQTVNIAKWREDIPGAAPSDLFLSSLDFPDMNPEFFELKHDSASEYSMDSAYHSQRDATRRGTTMPDGYLPLPAPDNRAHMNNQFLCSPTLSTDNFNGFSEQPQSDIGPMHLPSAAVEAREYSFAYANHTSAQEYPSYTTATVSQFPDMAFQPWVTAETQTFQPTYPFASHPKSTHSLEAAFYSRQEPTEAMFNTSQQHSSRPRIDTSVRTISRGSSFTTHQPQGTSSAHDTGFSFVMSPTSAVPEFEQQLESRNEKEETASTSLAAQSINDEDELLSPTDAAEAKSMEEEQGKLARSHPLYQAQPDGSGKYHCPHEGKPGCGHKPTTLKCNYDKYVDSHLKPFRCNKQMCEGVQFSSTACLLRHEREAHGMHGHGSRPHLCHFADCERSLRGNGFPRRYNLFDHMKRVHDFTGPTTEPSPPAPSHAPANRKSTSRKRKSTADEGGEKRQKVVKLTPQQQLEQRRSRLQAEFLSKKQNIINILTNLSGPNDLRDDIQLTKEVVLLHDISTEFKKSLGG